MSAGRKRGRTTAPPIDSERIRQEVLDELIVSHAGRAELLLIGGRLLILFASVASGLRQQAGKSPAEIAAVMGPHAAAIIALAVLALVLRRVRPRRLMNVLTTSVALDAVLLFLFFLPGVLWPGEEHRGILRAFGIGIFPLAIIAAGCRFRVRLAILGIASQLVGLLALTFIDLSRNPEQVRYAFAHLASAGTLLLTGSVLAVLVAQLTRRMVYAGAAVAVRARMAREKFRVYVSDTVVDHVIDSTGEEISLGGEQRYLAVLFCDLREFTRYANAVDPARLVAELNDYFEVMTPIIRDQAGTVDKFMGDSIMAVFVREEGKPPPGARALTAAAAMNATLARHNEERRARDLPPLRHGIGIHCGFAVVGNVGTADRLQYTVIGDVVNVASRLEKATKQLGTWLLCSRAVWEDAAGKEVPGAGLPELTRVGPLDLRGVEGEVEVFAPPPEPTGPARSSSRPRRG